MSKEIKEIILLLLKTIAFALVCVILMAMGGCSVLRVIEPDTLPIELTHVSHLTQHAPFTAHPTSYGDNIISVGAKWRPTKNFSITLSEGISLSPVTRWHTHDDGVQPMYGNLLGPKEVFTGRITYEVPLK